MSNNEDDVIVCLEDHDAFLDKSSYVSLLADSSRYLRDWNVKHSSTVGAYHGVYGTAEAGSLLLRLCQRLQQPDTVFFRALDLFQRFMEQHMMEMHRHILTNVEREHQLKEWKVLLQRIHGQVMLRLLSCLQIASKLTLHYKIITTKRIKYLLKDANHCYSLDSIVNSEVRVLKTLQFKVSTPVCLDYLETLVSQLAGDWSSWSPWAELATRLLCVSTAVLRRACVHRARLYSALLDRTAAAAGCSPTLSQLRRSASRRSQLFASVRADQELLTAAAMATGAALLLAPAHCDRLVTQLSAAARVDVSDLLDFSEIILRDLLEDDEKTSVLC